MQQINHSGIYTAPILLICLTSGGKSSVCDVYSIMNGGVFLTITLLLALGADQDKKISLKAKKSVGTIVYVHLDKIQLLADEQLLVIKLKLLADDGHTTVLLFSSPPRQS
jgi:hypothetical protein